MPGFSSTQNNGPSVGGLRSNSMMATALVANSGSRSFIQVLKAVQANLVPLEDDANRALAGMAQVKFGMSGDVLRQIVDAPVSLPSSRRVDLGGFLARQDQQPSLDIGAIFTRRWALGAVFEAGQALVGEAVAPDKDGPDGHTHLVRDCGIGLTVGDAQVISARYAACWVERTRGHDALQFSTFGGQQAKTSTTGSGTRHGRECFRCFYNRRTSTSIPYLQQSTGRGTSERASRADARTGHLTRSL
jgi:hypothetical protein